MPEVLFKTCVTMKFVDDDDGDDDGLQQACSVNHAVVVSIVPPVYRQVIPYR